MKCTDARENLAAYLDGEVDGAPRRAMDAHFAGCPDCAAERSAQAAAWRLLDLAGAPEAPADLESRILAAARAGGSPSGRILGLRRPAAAAAAAALLLAAGGGYVLLLRDGGGEGTGGSPAPHGGPANVAKAAAPPEALLEDLPMLEALEVLQDADLDVIESLSDMGDEDLAVLGG